MLTTVSHNGVCIWKIKLSGCSQVKENRIQASGLGQRSCTRSVWYQEGHGVRKWGQEVAWATTGLNLETTEPWLALGNSSLAALQETRYGVQTETNKGLEHTVTRQYVIKIWTSWVRREKAKIQGLFRNQAKALNHCWGLMWNVLRQALCLNTWSSISAAILKVCGLLRKGASLEEVSHWRKASGWPLCWFVLCFLKAEALGPSPPHRHHSGL